MVVCYQRTPRTIISNSVGCVCPCVQWEIKNILKNCLKTMFPRVGIIGGLVVYLARTVLGLGFWLIGF